MLGRSLGPVQVETLEELCACDIFCFGASIRFVGLHLGNNTNVSLTLLNICTIIATQLLLT
ncbi:hypothetical protein E2986_13536 [Frieseomelitta varia]|uniref:Uncharacterized protein n=1 Tax=Frieseomelitta varia TaxID=561572 RepID=A0A833VTX2_9HYME|nr:hypothetical protein E2986_13536 [Frieseomelitta varia]